MMKITVTEFQNGRTFETDLPFFLQIQVNTVSEADARTIRETLRAGEPVYAAPDRHGASTFKIEPAA